MTVIRKDATIQPVGSDEDFPGAFQVVLSAPTEDRDGDTLLPEEWKQPLPDHITFDSDHGMSVATTVGSGKPSIDPVTGNLIVSGTYSSLPRAQEVRTLVNEGHIRTTSVAFMTAKKQQKDGGGTTVERELLNGAFVAVPSNREALVLSSKGLKSGARNSASDMEHIQAIHDHAVALGAKPADDTPDDEADEDASAGQDQQKRLARADTKSVVGSLEATQDRARAALQDEFPGMWAWLQATVPSSPQDGVLVFQVEDPDTYETSTLQQSYTDDGDTITLTGDPSPVDLVQMIKPAPEEDAATSGAADAPASGAAKAAPVAGTSPAPVAGADSEETKAALAEKLLSFKAAEFKAATALAE